MSNPTFDFNKWLADAAEQMDMNGNLYLDGDGNVLKDVTVGYAVDDKLYAPEDVTIVKHAAYVNVSIEHMIDAGLMTEEDARARGWEPTVYPPVPWWRRLRWRIDNLRERLAYRLFRLVAGYEVRTDDE